MEGNLPAASGEADLIDFQNVSISEAQDVRTNFY
jgi:hypothetical protein